MHLKKHIYCKNYRETFAFYQKIMPFGFAVDVYEPGKRVVVSL